MRVVAPHPKDEWRLMMESQHLALTERLTACVAERVTALVEQIRPSQGIWDPVRRGFMPTSHYGESSLALALVSLEGGESRRWQDVLNAWLAVPSGGIRHEPFNRFLLLLLRDSLTSGNSKPDAMALIKSALVRFPLSSAYPSNNWTLLAELCRLLEADSAGARARSGHRFLALLDRWTTHAGGFIDYPACPRRHHGATPMAYHHKALFVAVVAAWHVDLPALEKRIQQLLNWVLLTWDGNSHVGGFGRSTHALYGDACLLASLVLMGFTSEDRSVSTGGRMIEGILQRWSRQKSVDALLALNPNNEGRDKAGWDDYMVLTVYNAWAAGILAWAQSVVGHSQPASNWLSRLEFPVGAPVREDAEAGLVRFESRSMVALVATRGQPPQRFGRYDVELRYAGGVPFHVVWRGKNLCPPPNRVKAEALRKAPALAGWTPVLLIGGSLFGLTDFETVRVDEDEAEIRINLTGRPVSLLRRPVIGWLPRMQAAIDWRLLNGMLGRREALRRQITRAVSATMVLSVGRENPVLAHELRIDNHSRLPVTYLNPAGHALITKTLPAIRKLTIRTPQRSTQVDLQGSERPGNLYAAALDSSIPAAEGYCLPSIDLPQGTTVSQVRLVWAES